MNPYPLKTSWRSHLLPVITGIFLLALFSGVAFAHGMSEEEKQAIIDGGNWSYLWLGATHMLSGYDHLAFVFGIIFFLTTFRDIAKYITAFTVGHSVTLIFATFNGIQLNYFLIDAIIALSVCYIAFANLDGFRKHLNINPPNMMVMITLLGLIHGFGLSTRLQALPLDAEQLLLNIIAFNLGIELGQVGALVIMLLLLSFWRQTHFFQSFSIITNYALILLGGFLFLMQMHGYEHATNEELAANAAPAASTVSPTDITVDDQEPWEKPVQITIPALGDTEHKIRVDQGQRLSFVWETDGEPLFFDFHGEPANDPNGSFVSFAKGTERQAEGSIQASFSGTHGWYWKNSSMKPVVVTLKTRLGSKRNAAMQDTPQTSQPEPTPAETHHSIF